MLEQFAGRACDPVEGTHGGAVHEELQPVGGTHAGAVREELQPVGRTRVAQVCEELSPVRGTFTLEQGKSVSSLPSEGQGAAETMYIELIDNVY